MATTTKGKIIGGVFVPDGTSITINGDGGGGGSGDATSIQGVDVDATAPTDGQTLVYNASTSKYEPSTISGSGASVNVLSGRPAWGYDSEIWFSELTDGDIETVKGLGTEPGETAYKFEFADTVFIEKIRFYVESRVSGGSILIYALDAHQGNGLGSIPVDESTENEWLEIIFDSPIAFGASQPLWIQPTAAGVTYIGEIQGIRASGAAYTVANAPSPVGRGSQVIYVSDGASGSPCGAVSSNGEWLRFPLGAPISAG